MFKVDCVSDNKVDKIPKVIHYIWLGSKPLPAIAKKCIKSWKKYCPDYQIKRWDENNLDLGKYKFAKDAYDSKKYAFASDVFRTEILYNEGGIYLDIDVEIIKPIDEFLNYETFGGFETSNLLNPGVIWGTIPKNEDLKEILEEYKNSEFDIDNCKNLTICKFYTEHYQRQGLQAINTTQIVGKNKFFASEYFSPKSLSDGKIRKTNYTYTIHHFAATWIKKSTKFKTKCTQFIKRIMGQKLVNKLKTKRGEKK